MFFLSSRQSACATRDLICVISKDPSHAFGMTFRKVQKQNWVQTTCLGDLSRQMRFKNAHGTFDEFIHAANAEFFGLQLFFHDQCCEAVAQTPDRNG